MLKNGRGATSVNNIQCIYKKLHFNSSVEEQLQGMELAKKIDDLSLLIQPPAEPSVWEKCAIVLSEKSDVVLEPFLNDLLGWLQDLNCPGALTILERLKCFSGKKLKPFFVNCYNQAVAWNNDEGLRWIDYLSELLDNKQLKAELPNGILEILQKHYKNWGEW